ncbi:MAG TPA: 2,5-diamino-6-(ribosylamino)-4(3H)-pyrimidinone 5'-phosphate reductase [Candidatus Nanopelagicaceae bacterium]|nr:2,5-diamino-6-(ribosylamino)-4(3H)-pyrimidinone 5'-phosphate reductase [Candidatus Nanopelagicaceae bacterium]
MKGSKRPYIILSAAMTIDGKIASKTGDPEISDEEDWMAVHKLRTEVDAIMIGKCTIISDNPKLHIKFYDHKSYYRIVLDSTLSIPIESNVVRYKPEIYPTIIATTENASVERIREFESNNIEIIKSGTGSRVDIIKLMPILYQKGIRRILLEGGGNLNWSFIRENIVDEIRIFIAPWMVGGKDAVSLVEGEGFAKMIESPRYSLINVTSRNNYVILKYRKMKR